VWEAGDPFTDLVPLLDLHRVLTIVTANGTATVLDSIAGMTTRVPLEGGHRMRYDLEWRLLQGVVVANTCVTQIDVQPGSFHVTTSARLVLNGYQPRWVEHPSNGATTLRQVIDQTPIPDTGHPDELCCAWCRTRPQPT
jgi:hypothetical protein